MHPPLPWNFQTHEELPDPLVPVPLDVIRSHEDLRVSTARFVLCAANPKNRAFSFQSGADAFLVRPFHLDELTEQIADVLARAQDQRARHRRDELARHGD